MVVGGAMPGNSDLAEIRQRQARDIAERLWLASRSKVLSPRRTFSINDAVDVALFLTDRAFKDAGVRLTRTIRPRLPEVDASMGEVEQALVSVLLNACEAAGPGGGISVATDLALDGEAVEVRVVDTGRGMSPEVLKRVYEPFFSTWGHLRVGLTTARELLERSGGAIRIDSVAGEGTSVLVRLPAAADS